MEVLLEGRRTAGGGGLEARSASAHGRILPWGPCAGGHCGTEGSMRAEHAMIRMAMGPEASQPVHEFQGREAVRRLPEGSRLGV